MGRDGAEEGEEVVKKGEGEEDVGVGFGRWEVDLIRKGLQFL
jgi:hypothetical protein